MAFVNDEQADVVVADPQEIVESADASIEVQETATIPESEQIKSKKRVADHGEVFTNSSFRLLLCSSGILFLLL